MAEGPFDLTQATPEKPAVAFKTAPGWIPAAVLLFLAAGVASFWLLLAGGQSTRAWQMFLVNFLFWPPLASAGVAVAAMFEVTKARWPVAVRPLAEACAAYLPVGLLLFLASWPGRRTLFPWHADPAPVPAAWLNLPFLYGREAVAWLVLCAAGLLFVYRSGRGSAAAPASLARGSPRPLAVALLILYVLVSTVFAWDFGMSIQRGWHSTMFGALFLFESLYAAVAVVTVLTIFINGRWRGGARLSPATCNNLGKLLLAFSMLWIYLFGSQYLVIWYGNLPREISFLLARSGAASWRAVFLALLALNFVVPFLILLRRASRENPKILAATGGTIAAGIWVSRFLLVVPALSPGSPIPLHWPEGLITAGFFASFLGTILLALRRMPALAPKGG